MLLCGACYPTKLWKNPRHDMIMRRTVWNIKVPMFLGFAEQQDGTLQVDRYRLPLPALNLAKLPRPGCFVRVAAFV
jgi:hypothetical protein